MHSPRRSPNRLQVLVRVRIAFWGQAYGRGTKEHQMVDCLTINDWCHFIIARLACQVFRSWGWLDTVALVYDGPQGCAEGWNGREWSDVQTGCHLVSRALAQSKID